MNTTTRSLSVLMILLVAGCGFAGSHYSAYDPPGFVMGIWHGLLAPYTLVLRLFMDIKMYAVPNSGWLYDCGFLVGILFALPMGWMAAIVAVAVHLL